MKTLILTFLLISSLLSCENKSVTSKTEACNVKDPVRNLPWLKNLIEKAKQDKEAGMLTITLWEFRGRPVFNYYKSYMSCIGCIHYNCDGSLIDKAKFTEQESEEFNAAFLDNSVRKTIIWPEK